MGKGIPNLKNIQFGSSSAIHQCCLLDEEEINQDDDKENVAKLTIDGAFGTIFAKDDADLVVPHYSVESLYSDTGFFQAVARSRGSPSPSQQRRV